MTLGKAYVDILDALALALDADADARLELEDLLFEDPNLLLRTYGDLIPPHLRMSLSDVADFVS